MPSKEKQKNNQTAKVKPAPPEKGANILVDEALEKKAKPGKAAKVQVTECNACARFLKVSPKKVKLVIDEIRGLPVTEALNKLQLLRKGSMPLVVKLIKSAMANAENNFKLKKENLYIKEIAANQGPVLKRFRPAAFGTAHPYRKRTTHLNIVLGVKEHQEIKKAKSKKAVKQNKTKSIPHK